MEIIDQLRKIKEQDINPNPAWIKSSRELLVAQIKNTSSPEQNKRAFSREKLWLSLSILLPRKFVFNVVRPSMALLLIFSLGGGGWIATVAASQDSLPGEWLYPAKRATEKTQMAVVTAVGAKEAETKMRVGLAKKRAQETNELIKSKDPEKMKEVPNVVSNLKDEIKKVDRDLDEFAKEKNIGEKVSAEVVKDLGKETEEIKKILKEAKIDLAVSVLTASSTSSIEEKKISTDLTTEITKAQDMTKEASVKAVEVLVGKHLQGDITVSKEEVKEAINEQVKSVVDEADEQKKVMEKVEEQTKKVSEGNINDGSVSTSSTLDATLDEQCQTASSTEVVKIKEVTDKTKQAVDKAKEVNQEIGQKVSRTEVLLSMDDFAGAVKVVREASDANKEAGKVAKETIKVLEQVAPTVVANALVDVAGQVVGSSTVVVEGIKNSTSSEEQVNQFEEDQAVITEE
ncbi:MAG: hypothetical protein ABIH87_04050 [bacterium]